MANENVVMNLTANADFSNLVANVNRVTTSLLKMQEQIGATNRILTGQIAATNKAFSETLRQTGQFGTHFVTLQDDVANFGNSLDKGQLKLRDYYSAWQQHARTSGGLIRDLATQQVQLQNAILQPLGKNAQGLMQFNVQVPKGLDLVKNKTALATQELKIMNKVMQEGANQLINWGKNTQWAGRQLTVGLTVPMAAFGAAASKAFREADQELVRLTKVYGGVAATSAAELTKIRNEVSATANTLAKQYGASYKETISLAADLAATGKQGNDLLQATAQTTRLMVLGEVDRQQAMKTTMTLQSTFKENTTQLTESINFLNAVENQTSLTIQDLTEAIPKAGPVIKALGGNVKDLALYLTAMKEGGIGAAEGANAIKSAFASLINPTAKATSLFKSFGIDLQGMVKKNTGNTTAMILDLQAALNKLDPLSKSKAIEQLFGKFQFARMSALIDNLGKQGSQSLQVLDLLKQSTGDIAAIADRELKQVTESASGKYKRAVEGLKADLAGIGDQFLKIQTFFINVTDKIVKFVNHLPGPIKTILTFLTGLTAITGPLIMLVGVMANFIGYVIKGAFHFKSLFKSGEGWRMLTPEILAAQKAGSLVEKTFYSDAKAALALAEALQVLQSGYSNLATKMNAGVIPVNPDISTIAGGTVIAGAGAGPRVVDPRNPLVGQKGTRASSHINPLAGRTPEEIAASTIYGFVPGAIPVNNAIKNAPQIYAEGDLPNIPGLTTAKSAKHGDISVGIVAGEATKFQTLMGTMSMMSKTEVAAMKKEIQTTGTVSNEFMTAYSSLLPEITSISERAVKDSAAIVAQVKSGELSLSAAKEKLIQLNYEIEQAMGAATTVVATNLGRTANLTAVPGTDQPVIDPNGKSNMRQLFGKGNSAWLDKLASALGVKTWGASYSTHTTIPKRLNDGGIVYDPSVHGNVVPGDTSINYDNTPAKLREGGFILNQTASKNNPDLVNLARNGYNGGGRVVDALLTPGETYFPPELAQQIMPTLESANNGNKIQLRALGGLISPTRTNYGLMMPRVISEAASIRRLFPGLLGSRHLKSAYEVKGTQGAFGGNITDPRIVEAVRSELKLSGNSITRSKINKLMEKDGVSPDILLASIYSGKGNYRLSTDVLLEGLVSSGIITAEERQSLSDVIFQRYAKDLATLSKVNDMNNPVLESSFRGLTDSSLGMKKRILVREALEKFAASPGMVADVGRRSSSGFLQYIDLSNGTRVNLARLQGKGTGETFYHAPMPSTLLRTLPSNVQEAAIARYNQDILNLDPAHGLLQIGRYRPPMSVRNQYVGAKIGYKGTGRMLQGSVPAFELGLDVEQKAKEALYRYMMGDYSTISDPVVQQYLSSIRTKQSGTFFRGIRPGSSGLPHQLDQAIRLAQVTGDWSSLIGHEFIMRRSSWSSNKDTASGFGSVLLTAGVKNRNAIAASQIFPDLKFHSPQGTVSVNENEFYMGGKFKVIGAQDGHLQLQAIIDGKKENGGNVNAGSSYLVGERGPELFTPNSNGHIASNYVLGGLVRSNQTGYGMSPTAKFVGGNILGLALMQLIGPLSQKLGLNPSLVNNVMTAGYVGQVAYTGRKIYKASQAAKLASSAAGETGAVAEATAAAGTEAAATEGILAKLAPRFLTLAGVASKAAGPIGLVVTALQVYKMMEDSHRHNQEIYSVSFGLTAKTAKEAGIAIQDLDKQLKTSSELTKNTNTRAALLFSQDSAGVKGLSLTVGQLKELEKSVKSTMPTYMEAFKKMTSKDLETGAANIKAQWVAMGMSIQDANAKIYTLIKLTHGADAALSAITSGAFKGITDKASASEYAIKLVGQAIKNINNTGAKGAASALDTFFQIQTARVQALQDQANKNKKSNPNTIAYTEVMSEYQKSGYANIKITRDMITELSKTQPILASILNATDTIGSSMSKWIIATSGSIPNLSKIASLTDAQANTVAKGIVAVQDASVKALGADTLIGAKEAQLGKLQGRLTAASKASVGMTLVDQIGTKKRIKYLEDEIKKIDEAATARKKALDQQIADSDTLTQIQKKQLDYQQALAAGDMAAAAQAQLEIQSLTANRQLDVAKNSIDINAKNLTGPMQNEIDKLNNSLTASSDAQALAADSMDKLSTSINDLVSKDSALKSSLQKALDDKLIFGADSKTFQNDIKVLFDDYVNLAGLKKNANGVYTDSKGNTITPESIYASLEKSTISNMSVSAQTIMITAGEILTGKNLYSNNPLGTLPKTKSTSIKTNENKPLGDQNPNVPFSPPKNPSDKTGESGIDAIHNPLFEKNKYKKNKAGFYNIPGDPMQIAPKNLIGTSGDYYFGPNGNVYLKDDKTQFVGRWYSITEAGKVGYAGGGKISGPGTGKSDSIPAMLSNGEYVVNADSVSKYGVPFFDAVNAKKLANGGYVQHFKNGSHGGVKDGNFWSRFNPVNMFDSMLSGMFSVGASQTMKTPINIPSTVTQKEKDYIALKTLQDIYGYTSAFNLKNNTSPKLFGHKNLGIAADVLAVLPIIGGASKLTKLGVEASTASLYPTTLVHAAMSDPSIVAAVQDSKNISLTTLKNILKSNTKAKEIINGIYKRKDLVVDEKIYPTYKLNGNDERFAFQGYKEDLSKLKNSGIRIVPTTPEGLLKESLRLNPENIRVKSLLNNITNNKIGRNERIFLDEITSATGINSKGALTGGHQTDGFAMVLSALSGDTTAQNILNVKRSYMYAIIKANKAAAKLKNESEANSFSQDVNTATPDSLSVIHSTKYPVTRDEFGNIVLQPHGQYVLDKFVGVPRASIHTTLEAPVESHIYGNWADTNNKIISPLSSMIKDNGLPYNLNSTDTWWMRNPGQGLKISNGVVIRPYTTPATYYRALINAGIIKNGAKAPLIAIDKTGKNIYRLAKEKFTPADIEEIQNIAKANDTHVSWQQLEHGDINSILDDLATKIAKRNLGVNPSIYKLDQWSLGSTDRQNEIYALVKKLKLRGGIHSQSTPEHLETNLMRGSKYNENLLNFFSADSIEGIRFATLFGRFMTNIKKLPDPNELDWLANGGLVSNKMRIPKFDKGINMVPQDMLAVIHKNEAVVPANMNPFNPNAVNATMGGTINITNNITAAPGMDTEMLAMRVVDMTRKALKSDTSLASAKIGNNIQYGSKVMG